MSLRNLVSLSTLAALIMFSATSAVQANQNYGIANFNSDCIGKAHKWSKAHGWKALTLSNLFDGPFKNQIVPWQECGLSWNAASRTEAINLAMKQCNKGIHKHKAEKIASCKIVNIKE